MERSENLDNEDEDDSKFNPNIMIQSYPNDKSAMSEDMAKEYFISAIDDPELKLKVRERENRSQLKRLLTMPCDLNYIRMLVELEDIVLLQGW